jgi:hypothetical protein
MILSVRFLAAQSCLPPHLAAPTIVLEERKAVVYSLLIVFLNNSSKKWGSDYRGVAGHYKLVECCPLDFRRLG